MTYALGQDLLSPLDYLAVVHLDVKMEEFLYVLLIKVLKKINIQLRE